MAETGDYYSDAATSADIDLLLSTISKLANVAFFVWNEEDGRPLYISSQLAKFYRLSMPDFMARFPNEQLIAANMVGDDGARYLAASGSGNYELEFRAYRSDGTIGFAREVGDNILDADTKRVLRSAGAVIDITAMKETEQALTEALKYQTATGEILNVISRSPTDIQPVLEVLTKSAANLCAADESVIYLRKGEEYHAHAAFGTMPGFLDFLKANPRKLGQKSLVPRVIETGVIQHIPDLLLDQQYDFPELAQFTARRAMLGVPILREGRVEGVFVLSRQVPGPFSDRQVDLMETLAGQALIAMENARLFKALQLRTEELSQSLEDLRAAQDRLVQTEKLASLGQLTAGIAHEIKNPLNFVNNFSSLSIELVEELSELLAKLPLEDKLREEASELTGMLNGNLGKVVQHGRRADSIVKNMLLHSRHGSGEHRPVNVNAVVEESLNLAYHGARAERKDFNVTLERDFDPEAGEADLYPQEITRVLLNLMSNGFYATSKRAAQASGDYDPMLSASTKNLGQAVAITIRDNGIGIPPEVKEKMFNPFFTTKPAGEGTGLGLSLSHDIIVKQHAGTIEVDTEPGRFTEFRIVLSRNAATVGKKGGPV